MVSEFSIDSSASKNQDSKDIEMKDILSQCECGVMASDLLSELRKVEDERSGKK